MTTKKYATYIKKQCKSLSNISFESIFGEYIVTQHNQRIGLLYQDQLYLLSNLSLKKLLPNASEINLFDGSFQRLIHIENTEDITLLNKMISATYHDLYFLNEYLFDVSDMIKPYHAYTDVKKKTYDLFITFFTFCFEKKLIKLNPLDQQNRILYMRYTNNDLTELGIKIMNDLLFKWLEYTDKNDAKTAERIVNVKILEKYYQQLTSSL